MPQTDLLTQIDFFDSFIDITDFIAALLSMGFVPSRANQLANAFYAGLGSSLGRIVSSSLMGDQTSTFGMLMAGSRIQNDALLSSLIMGALVSSFNKVKFITAFEQSAATMVVAKCTGAKLQTLSKSYPYDTEK